MERLQQHTERHMKLLALTKIINWLDRNFLGLGISFLLFFIPLYPKLPLFGVNHTWVYVRLEDFAILLLGLCWLFLLILKKISVKTPLTIPIFLYWAIGAVSLLFTLYVTAPHLANFFPNVAIFHYLRRIEYMTVFLIAFSSVRDVKQIRYFLIALLLGLVGVIIYGFGQKYLGFPAFLTMNEEFAKGTPLRLGPSARISSTFGGQYDLAAYLVILITVCSSFIIGLKERLIKIAFIVLTIFSLMLLLFTASRVSFAVCLLTIAIVLVLHKKSAFIPLLVVTGIFLMLIVSGTSERFAKTLRVQNIIIDALTGKPIATAQNIQTDPDKNDQANENLPEGTYFLALPISKTNQPIATTTALVKQSLPSGLKTPDGKGYILTKINGSFLIQKALVYDISFTTRLQGGWPRALQAFGRNSVLGTGYSSISLATDNDYLRALGETGILGFVSFFGIFCVFFLFIKKSINSVTDQNIRTFVIGVTGALVGLLVNALMIDVFEASKVAYIIWMLLGISIALLLKYTKKQFSLIREIQNLIPSKWFALLFFSVIGFTVFLSSLSNYFVGDDFTWLRWAATTSVEGILKYFTDAAGFFYRPIEKLFFLTNYFVFWLNPVGYHFLGLIIHIATTWMVYLLTLKLTNTKLIALISGLFFLLLPMHHESIFWSSSSGGLFAGLFFLISVYFYIVNIQTNNKVNLFLSLTSFTLALLSHEVAVTLPLVILFLNIFYGRIIDLKRKRTQREILLFWLILGFYFLIRWYSKALTPSGDYSYNILHLPFNFIGNYLGYWGIMIFSERAIPVYDLIRRILSQDLKVALILLTFAVGIVLVLISLMKGKVINLLTNLNTKILFFSVIFSFITLLPYLGLGNLAERYGYIASFSFSLILATLLYEFYNKIKLKHERLSLLILTSVVTVISIFYAVEINRINGDWKNAGEIVKMTLSLVKQKHPNFSSPSEIYFVNIPIRLNRAWVFPVGLKDGIWFYYRDNPNFQINVTGIGSLEEATRLKGQNPNAYIFIFKDNKPEEVN